VFGHAHLPLGLFLGTVTWYLVRCGRTQEGREEDDYEFHHKDLANETAEVLAVAKFD
jgi:hypothetical protein